MGRLRRGALQRHGGTLPVQRSPGCSSPHTSLLHPSAPPPAPRCLVPARAALVGLALASSCSPLPCPPPAVDRVLFWPLRSPLRWAIRLHGFDTPANCRGLFVVIFFSLL